jgi:hypothetical protein
MFILLIFDNKDASPNRLEIVTLVSDVEKIKSLYASVYSGYDYTVREVVL